MTPDQLNRQSRIIVITAVIITLMDIALIAWQLHR